MRAELRKAHLLTATRLREREEELASREEENAAALEFPETAEELRLKVAEPNRDMGRTLAIGALVMFFIVMTTVVTIVYAL